MKCPCCGKSAKVPDNTVRNVETYDKSALSVMECCGQMAYVSSVRSFTLSPYSGDRNEDDWGRKVYKA
jgi:hypothetical protein